MGAGAWEAIAAGRQPPAVIISCGTTRGRAQWITIPSECGAAHRRGAGFLEDPRRENPCFPQRDSVGQPLGTVFKNPLTVEDGKVDFSRTLTYPSACSPNKYF